ncbi:hypothetical protein C8Q74DRAFT_1219418 [Fomes fomentarius]|nr:hypothetical protein C8Q74DRAFT_1219418 [Fomes fomentarius]
MDDSRLPIEMCEHIIDLLDDAWAAHETKTAWRHTSLVCCAWLPRSRFNLYRQVYLSRPEQARLLLKTLEDNSHLARLVVEFEVTPDHPPDKYIPFSQLARLLQNCVILNLDVAWDKRCPPRFVDTCLHQFSLLGIVDFTASSLRNMEPIRSLGARRSQDEKPAALSELKELDLLWHSVSIKFPPHYFGDTVVDLHLNCCSTVIDESVEISLVELLQCIENFQRLQTLFIQVDSDKQDDTYNPLRMSKIRRLFSILTRVSSGSALQTLSIELDPQERPERSYNVGRSGLLDLLVGVDMLKVLDGFPSLSELHFKLWENDEDYDEVWWEEQMVRRLPDRLHTVTVAITEQVEDGIISPPMAYRR